MNIIILFCFLSQLVAGDIKFHEDLSKDHLIHYFGTPHLHKVPDYEYTNPIPVTGRHRRTTEDVDKQYIIKAFGEEYHLQLNQNQYLHSPGCLVFREKGNNTREVRPCPKQELSCVYHGHVSNYNESWAAVSTCIGVHGIISVPGHDLMIQPIRKEHLNRVQKETSVDVPHIVYRRQVTGTRCGTSENTGNEHKTKYSRTKRAASQRYIEMKVVMAPDSSSYHGSDAERYISTVMNVAAQRLGDPSLGSEIRLGIVQITILHADQPGLNIQSDSKRLLDNFCFWQEKKQPAASSPLHADGALLITRKDLYYGSDETNLGLGNVKGMCKQNLRCSVNEDNGLDLGLTIAHETGHTLGMSHDGDGNSCQGDTYIMSGSGATGHSATKWSSCSKRVLDEFLGSSESDCLNNVPSSSSLGKVNTHQHAGMLYSADTQCKIAMDDEGSTVCPGTSLTVGNECKMLVCYTHDKRTCSGVGSIRMDGTECGHRRWCIEGDCVAMGAGAPAPINGGWSDWDKEWTACSRTCGGGAKLKHRKCNNPEPRFGGTDCQGDNVKAQICNLDACSNSQMAYREEQCAATNSEPLEHHRYNWKPFEDEKCQLKCYAEGANIVVYRGNHRYSDGTECSGDGSFSRCIDAKCQNFGCDGHMNSGFKFDHCLVCNGQSTTCSPHTGQYSQGTEKAYVTFVTIPKGATSVIATNGNGYSHMTVKVGSHRMFGETSRARSNTYKYNHLTVKYRASGPEKIEIIGPLPFAVELQVWRDYGAGYRNVDPQISYTYYTANAVSSPYKWLTMQGSCSRSCGTGESVVNIYCVRKSDRALVGDRNCNIFLRPSETPKPCNTHSCPPQWHTDEWKQCSSSCAGGTQSRDVRCVVTQGDTMTAVTESRCDVNHKPVQRQQCNTQPCPGVWVTGGWSRCSKTCGRGARTRTVTCQKSSQSHEIVPDEGCGLNLKPAVTAHCLDSPCLLNITGDSCVDKTDCTAYADDVCESYGAWAEKNCMLFCGVCVKDPSVYTCRDMLKCSEYGANMCQGYPDFWKKNCAKSCGLCNGGSPQTTTPKTTGACVDKIDCTKYNPDICTNSRYRTWATINCAKHCGICHVTPCEDKVECSMYQNDVCDNSRFKAWAQQNCGRYCGFCRGGYTTHPTSIEPFVECVDKVTCTSYASDICTSATYKQWTLTNCPKHCRLCTQQTTVESHVPCDDKVNCAKYGSDVCTNDHFRQWAMLNCAKHCRFCHSATRTTTESTPISTAATGLSACVDKVDCSRYAHDVCSNHQYESWAHKNCRKHCGFCVEVTTIMAITTTESAPPGCDDRVKCSLYASDICTSSGYRAWARKNCAKTCSFCTAVAHTTTRPQTTPSPSCVDKVNCGSYQKDICTSSGYSSWAKLNCAKHCGFCDSKPMVAPHHSSDNEACTDKADCSSYQKDICTNSGYHTWAKQNCKKYCGFCGTALHTTVPAQTTPSCVDKLNCNNYEDSICTSSSYKAWAQINCAKHCGFCGGHSATTTVATHHSDGGSCADKIDCSAYDTNICTNEYQAWAKLNCPKSCGFCGSAGGASTAAAQTVSSGGHVDPCHDNVDCSAYDSNICTQYGTWAQQNCPRTCSFCTPCTDKIDDCHDYGDDICQAGSQYAAWAKMNCAKRCNLCGARRKRSVEDLLERDLDAIKAPEPILVIAPRKKNMLPVGDDTVIKVPLPLSVDKEPAKIVQPETSDSILEIPQKSKTNNILKSGENSRTVLKEGGLAHIQVLAPASEKKADETVNLSSFVAEELVKALKTHDSKPSSEN